MFNKICAGSLYPIKVVMYLQKAFRAKDISVINTPPQNRLPIKTYVGEYNEQTVKNAITNELDRDGQVFYLYNRVETIEEFKIKLQEIVPNARNNANRINKAARAIINTFNF